MIEKCYSKWEAFKNRFYSIIEKQIREKPHKVALGCAIGIGINFIPTLGIGFIFAYLLAMLFKVNRACATATSLLTGPFVPLMYALNFVSGGLILTPAMGDESITDFIIREYSMILKLGNLQEKIYSSLELLGVTFLLGSAINAAVFGTAFYFFVIFMLNKISMRDRANKHS